MQLSPLIYCKRSVTGLLSVKDQGLNESPLLVSEVHGSDLRSLQSTPSPKNGDPPGINPGQARKNGGTDLASLRDKPPEYGDRLDAGQAGGSLVPSCKGRCRYNTGAGGWVAVQFHEWRVIF